MTPSELEELEDAADSRALAVTGAVLTGIVVGLLVFGILVAVLLRNPAGADVNRHAGFSVVTQ